MSEVRLSAPVKATRVDDLFDGPGRAPGAFKYWAVPGEEVPAGLNFRCPCGCDGVYGVAWNGHGGWTWDGNHDAPTCSPSVLAGGHSGPHWHGYLRAGQWVQA